MFPDGIIPGYPVALRRSIYRLPETDAITPLIHTHTDTHAYIYTQTHTKKYIHTYTLLHLPHTSAYFSPCEDP